MNKLIKLECIGMHQSSQILRALGLSVPNRYWVAEIVDISMRSDFERKFIRPKYDYSQSNSKGSRGVYAEYELEPDKVYEISSPVSWNSTDRYFCKFDEAGEQRLTKDQVEKWLMR